MVCIPIPLLHINSSGILTNEIVFFILDFNFIPNKAINNDLKKKYDKNI